MAVIFEMIVSALGSALVLLVSAIVVVSDDDLRDLMEKDHKEAMKEFSVNHPGVFIFMNFINAYLVAAVVEEMVKYFGFRMVVTPDLLTSSQRNGNNEDGNTAKSLKSTGAGITVAVRSSIDLSVILKFSVPPTNFSSQHV